MDPGASNLPGASLVGDQRKKVGRLEEKLDPRGYLTDGPDEPNTYGPGELVSFAAHAALANPGKVQFIPESEAEERAFRHEQRRLLARKPKLRQHVASRAPAPIVPLRDVGHDARPATNARRRGSHRQSGSSPPSDDPDEADLHPRTCPICGADLDGLRSDATYCSPACRIEASRRRRLGAGEPVEGYPTLAAYLERRQRRTKVAEAAT